MLTYTKITGTFVAVVGDLIEDEDALPNSRALEGTVTFTPEADRLKIGGETPRIIAPKAIVAEIDSDGALSLNGAKGVYLLSSDSPGLSPTGFTYRVSFSLTLDGEAVAFRSYSIFVTGEAVDLTELTPVDASAGTVTVVTGPDGMVPVAGPSGPPGEKGEDGDSAYEIAVAAGYVGSITDWLASLHGTDGVDGADGADGIDQAPEWDQILNRPDIYTREQVNALLAKRPEIIILGADEAIPAGTAEGTLIGRTA